MAIKKRAKLISPGPGSSGYYPPETLERAAQENIFSAGTHMYWNHQSKDEQWTLPERNLNHLAGVLETNAVYEPAGPDGAGLYADVLVFSDYQQQVEEKGQYSGLSVVGMGEGGPGKLPDGRDGLIITRIVKGESVDFVTRPGRDGKILFESAKPEEVKDGTIFLSESARLVVKEKQPMPPENSGDARYGELEKRLAEVQAQNAALTAQVKLGEANRAMQAVWLDEKYKSVPAPMRRIFEQAALAVNDDLNATKLTESVQKSADAYLASLPVAPAVNNGDSQATTALAEADVAQQSALKKYIERYKLTEAQAKVALGMV
jgi:hypothetical protein